MLPDQIIEYTLEAERRDPHARRWLLVPQPWRRVMQRGARHDAARAVVASDPAALEALAYDQAAERFAECVVGVIDAAGTRCEDRAVLTAMLERMDLETFGELVSVAQSEPRLKAGAKNWPGSSSSGTGTPPMQEPADSVTP